MTPGARVRPAQVPASTDDDDRRLAVGAVGARSGGRRPLPPSASGSHQPRSRATRSRRGTTSRRTSAAVSVECVSAAVCDASSSIPAFGGSTNRSGSGACPYRDASAAHRSRHAAGVASGTSRCAPASQTSDHDRGTTRYASYPPPPVASHRPPAYRCAIVSTSRAASPIAVVVTRRCASGSQAWESAPCWETIRSGPNAAASSGSSDRTAASHAPSPVPGWNGTLTEVPAALPSPSSPTSPVPGKRYRPVSWNDRVRTPGSSQWIAWTPSPWWTSRSTYRTRRPSRRARAMASAGIVVDAEPGRAVGHRVMEPAARVEGVLDVAAEDRLDRPERAAGDHRRRPRASRRRADRRRPRRCPPRTRRTGRPRTA